MPQELLVQGRIVFGHPNKARPKKDMKTKQPIIKDGQPVQEYIFGIAIDKNTFGQQIWPVLYNEARAAFPNGIPSNFTYKFKDGDAVDTKGQPYNKREGYAGHCVLTVSTQGFAPQVFKNENGSYRQLQENEIKCGDFVAVKLTVKFNGATGTNTPGLYINPNGVVLLGYGAEIVSAGQDPDEMFAGMQAQQFHGMSATPVMSSAPLPTAMAPGVAYPPAQPAYAAPAPAGYPPQPAAPLPPPAHDFVRNATGQPPQPGYPPAPANPGYPPAQPASYGAPAAYPSNPAPAAPGYPPAGAATPGYPPAAPGYPGAPTGR